jgi:hypothetical protein
MSHGVSDFMDSFERGTEFSGSMKGGEFVD